MAKDKSPAKEKNKKEPEKSLKEKERLRKKKRQIKETNRVCIIKSVAFVTLF